MMRPVISHEDYRLLRQLVLGYGHSEKRSWGEEIIKARVVQGDELDSEVVRLNSEVEVQDMSSGRKIGFRLVLPDQTDVKQRRISVFAPLSAAILGFRV